LATYDEGSNMKGFGRIKPIQLTDSHTVDNELERSRVLSDHPDDPAVIAGGKVKGKLKVTRALGVGYLKKVCKIFIQFISIIKLAMTFQKNHCTCT
jgi:pyruvate dehydrogenase phosphatase